MTLLQRGQLAMTSTEAFIAQWELANEMLDELEGRDKDIVFDLMMAAAIELGRAGYKLTPDNHWGLYESTACC